MSAKSTTTGTIVMIDAAKSEFQCWTYAVTYEVIPTVSGRLSGSVMRVSATMYSFHAAMNAKITAVTTPGSDSGSTIRTSTRRRPQPSIAAASSISRGMEAKNARRIQMAKARLNAALVRMSAAYVLMRPSSKNSRCRPTTRVVGENIWVTSTRKRKVVRPRNRWRAV